MQIIPTIIQSTIEIAAPQTTKVLIWDVSSALASRIYAWSSIILIGGAAAAAIGTLGTVLFGIAKEHFASQQIAETSLEAARLKEQNLIFEKAFAPRTVEQNLSARDLSKYKGARFLIVPEIDFEARKTAARIGTILIQAGWKEYDGERPNLSSSIRDGITVSIGSGEYLHAEMKDGRIDFEAHIPKVEAAMRASSEARERSDALISVLKERSELDAGSGAALSDIPRNVVVVLVGVKPLPDELKTDPAIIPADENGVRVFNNEFWHPKADD